MPNPIIASSILAADFTHLEQDIKKSIKGGAEWIHCDIMDGHFVPNISFGPLAVEAANRSTDSFLDVHLMIYNPDDYVETFVKSGADQITVHYEAVTHLHRSIQNIKSQGIRAGVAINPATSIQNIEPILPDVDMVLLMTVNPGFGGQQFIEHSYERIKELAVLRRKEGLPFLIEVDGGIGMENIEQVSHCGADVFVIGSNIFHTDDITKSVEDLYKKAVSGKQLLV